MAGYSGDTEALAVQLAPEGFGFRRPPGQPGFVEFGAATFRAGASEPQRPRHEAGLLGSLVLRPMVFRRNDTGWIAACAWRRAAKADDLVALKRAKREIDQQLILQASELVSTLIRQLHGEGGRGCDHVRSLRSLAPAGFFWEAPCNASQRSSDCPSSRFCRPFLLRC